MLQFNNKQYSLAQLHLAQTFQLPSPNKTQHSSAYHTSFLHKHSLYHYAWPDTCTAIKLQSHHQKHQKHDTPINLKLNQQSFLNLHISQDTPSFASALLNNQLHFLITKTQPKPESPSTPSLIKLNLATGIYSQVHTSGQHPSPRIAPLIQTINNMYILVYGGLDQNESKSSQTAYALMFWEWHRLNVISPIQPRINFASTIIGNKIYLHGGHAIKTQKTKYFCDLYELTFSDVKKQLIFQEILPFNGSVPLPRSNHQMVSVSDRYLAIFGGVSDNKNNQGPQSTINLKDLWIFDLVQKTWHQIPIDLEKFNCHSLFSLSSHLNELFIFGAFYNPKTNKKTDLIKLEFPEKLDKKPTSFAHYQIQNPKFKDNLEGSNIEFATNLIHNTSYLIKSPFQAIQRIIEFAQNQNAQLIQIYSETTTHTIEKYIYISINIKTPEDNELSSDFETEVQKLFVYCLRLGKTAIYVQNCNKKSQRKVFMMSADGRFVPLLERLQLIYSYTESSDNSGILSVQNSRNKQIIHTILEGLIDHPEAAIRSIEGGKIMIFTPNIIPTPKSYFYELIFDSPIDISLFKNNKKLELLDKLKYDLATSMEFSLHSYLKYSNTNQIMENKRNTKVFLSKSTNPVPQDNSYANRLQEFSKQGHLLKIKVSPSSHIKHTISYNLYVCQQNFYLPENNGILLFQNGQLVNRYDCQFGKLLQDKFYQKKIPNYAKNIFAVVGQVNLSTQLGLMNFKTEFQKTNKFIEFQLSLQNLVAKFLKNIQATPQIERSHCKEARNTISQHQNILIDDLQELNAPKSKENEAFHIKRQSVLPQEKESEEILQESHQQKPDDQFEQMQQS